MVQLVRLGVVGHEQVRPAVVVIVEHGDSERFRAGVEDAGVRRDVFERAVAAVVEEPAGLAAIRFRGAVLLLLSVDRAENVQLGRPLHVIADEQIEQAVAVVIEPQRGAAEGLPPAQAGLVGDVHEGALAGVVEQPSLAHRGDVEVGKTVVVVVADGDTHAVHFDVEPGLPRDIGEGAVAVVAVELHRGALFVVPGPIHPLHQEDVLPAVAIVIEKCASRAHALGQELGAVGAAVVEKADPGLRRDVFETEAEAGFVLGRRVLRQRVPHQRAGGRNRRQTPQELPAVHGVTRPFRMA